MFHHKRFLLLGSIVLLAVTLFTFSPMSAPKAFAASLNGCPPEQAYPGSSDWVKVLQATLNAQEANSNGLFSFGSPLSVDGQYGQNTENAVRAWQTFVGGTGDAPGLVVGHGTWASLGYCVGTYISDHLKGSTQYSSCPPNLSSGSSGVWVEALQDMLNVDLWFGNMRDFPQYFTPYLANDGSFGPQTQAAVFDFQALSGIREDGSVGPQTWGKLRMCW
jgi:peptidoglycan hydrolase-like protein with peptidoglycan-binding domain